MTSGTFTPVKSRPDAPVPPLRDGDRLTREEFERRFDATPGLKRAELIDGVVHIAPPALRWDYHARPDGLISGWLMFFESSTPGVQMGNNASIRLNVANEPQPDATLLIEAACGGQATIDSENYVHGAPELVIEISASTKARDLSEKLPLYQQHGVREYIVWRVEDGAIDWFSLTAGRPVPLPPDPQGVIRSVTFPGLWLDTTAMLRLDSAGVLRTLQQGIATAEHADFVNRLAAARAPKP